MTTVYGDDWLRNLRPQPSRMSAPEYESLSEEISRAIEVVDGYVVYCEAPSPEHNLAGRRLATLLELAARRAMAKGHRCLTVNTDIDLRLQDVPLLNRRPDVILYRCLDRENNERLRADHVLLVVEIVQPWRQLSEYPVPPATVDTVDKLGEYARAGIPHYWVVRLDASGVSVVERYRLDEASRLYKHVGTFMKDENSVTAEVANPIPVTIDWPELEF